MQSDADIRSLRRSASEKSLPPRNRKFVFKREVSASVVAWIHYSGSIGWAVVVVCWRAARRRSHVACRGVSPRLIDRLTPNIDEGKEIARGNLAVAQYFGLSSPAASSA